MTPQHEAEYRLVACLLRDGFEGGERFAEVESAHIANSDLRAIVEAMQSGMKYVDLMCTPNKNMAKELIASEYMSPQYVPDLYRYVKNFWIEREILKVRMETSELSGIDQLFKLKERLDEIESGITEQRSVQAAERFAAKLERKKPLLSTRIPSLDRALGGGLDDSDKVIIGGRPSRGKTALAVHLGRLQSENGIKTGYWSIESPDDQIIRRAVASRFGIDTRDIRSGKYTPEMKRAMIEYAMDLQNNKGFHIFNSSGLSYETIAREMLLSEHKICIVDHMQKFRGKDLRQVIGDASNAFAGVANQKNKIVILLSQLNTRKDDDREPTMGDLKESGDLEQDADIIIFPHIPDAEIQMKEVVVDVKLIVAKARESGIGYVELRWNKATNTFFELDNIHQEPQTHF